MLQIKDPFSQLPVSTYRTGLYLQLSSGSWARKVPCLWGNEGLLHISDCRMPVQGRHAR